MDGIAELRKILSLWKSQGETIIIAEHRLFFLRELADRVLLFENGRITRQFSAGEFSELSAAETSALGIRCVELPEFCEHETRTALENSAVTLEGLAFTYPDKVHGIAISSLSLPQLSLIHI